MKTITRADWGLQLEAFARAIAPLIAAAWLAVLLTKEALAWARRLLAPASAAELKKKELAVSFNEPIRIPAAELLAAGGLEAAEIEAILAPPAPNGTRSKSGLGFRPCNASANAVRGD